MVFERIITVSGHQYKYLVMNVREGKKIRQKTIKYLGRVDKGHEQGELDSPYGLYYFAQDNCDVCETKEQVEHSLMGFQRVIKDEILPRLRYVNLSRDKNPLNINISATPTAIEITHTKIFKGHDFYGLYDNAWLAWRYGEKRAEEIKEASMAAWKQEQEDIIQHIREGKDGKWLKKKGYNELDILTARKHVRQEKAWERHKLKRAKQIKEYEEWKRKEELKKCEGGACQLPA